LVDRNTLQVFGDYISNYDIYQSIRDKSTVPIYYESRLAKLMAKLKLDEASMPTIDEEFDEITEDEEEYAREKLKSKWSRVAELAGDPDRLEEIANDLIEHFENRIDVIEGKALIVCMSRNICVDLYNQIIKIRPEWHSDDDDKGKIKVVMSGSASDIQKMQLHIRPKYRRELIKKRIVDPKDPLKIVIVRDMWLTGFDAPCLHTMYIDKPMQGHNLMQAIARVNRVYKDFGIKFVMLFAYVGRKICATNFGWDDISKITTKGLRGKLAKIVTYLPRKNGLKGLFEEWLEDIYGKGNFKIIEPSPYTSSICGYCSKNSMKKIDKLTSSCSNSKCTKYKQKTNRHKNASQVNAQKVVELMSNVSLPTNR